MPYKLMEPLIGKTVEVKKKRISSGIVQNYRSKKHKENNIEILVETENKADAKEVFKDIRKLLKKKDRLLDKGLSYQMHCSMK